MATISRPTCTWFDASNQFLGELAGVADPQKKRKIIGRVFIEVFRHEAKSIKDADFRLRNALPPTKSNREPTPMAPLPPSSRTTTWVACPLNSASS